MGTSQLYLVLRAVDTASPVMRGFMSTLTEADRAAAKAHANMMARGRSLALIGIGVAAGGIVAIMALNKMANAAIDYTQQAALTQTQTDKVAVSLQELMRIGLDVATKLPVTFAKIQPTLYDIFSSIDVNAPQAARLLENIGKASVAGQADMQVVGRATVAILNAYKMKTEDVIKVNDVMFQLVRKGVGTYNDFTNVIGRVVPSAVKAGQTFETTAGMMAFLTRNGMSAAMASTSAARAMDSLSKTSVVKHLRDIGVAVIDSTGHFRPMVDIIHDLKAKLSGLPPAIQAIQLNNIFKGSGANIQTMRFLNLAINDSTNLLGKMVNAMKDAGGASDAAYKIMSETPAAKIELLKNHFTKLAITIGQDLIPAKLWLIKVLTSVVDWFNKLSPTTQKFIAIFFGIVAVTAVVIGAMIALGGVIIIMRTTFTVLGDTMIASMAKGAAGVIKSLAAMAITGARSAATLALSYLEAFGAMIAEMASYTLAMAAQVANQARLWLIIQVRAYAARTATETSIAVQIASWIALKLVALANAAEIAAAWLLAMGPVGWVILAGAAIVGVAVATWLAIKQATKDGGDAASREAYNAGRNYVSSYQRGLGDVRASRGMENLSMTYGSPSVRNFVPSPTSGHSKASKAAADAAAILKDKKGIDDLQKMLDDLLNPKKKKSKGPGVGNSSLVSDISTHINTLKTLIKTGIADIAKAAKEMPIAISALGKGSVITLAKDIVDVQKSMDVLSKKTPNQLKAMGVKNVQKLIDGLKSKEAALMAAYDDVLFKTLLNAQTKAQALADRGAVAINAFISKMTGDLGKDAEGVKIAFQLGADVVDAYATGMTQSDPKARLAAHNALVTSVQNAYQAVLDKLEAVKQGIADKMKAITATVSSAIMTVVSFGTVYSKSMEISKIASEALAVKNKLALESIQDDYKIHIDGLNTLLQEAKAKLSNTASSITSAIMNAMNFSNAASEANKFENTFMDQLVLQAKKARDFSSQIKRLIAMGLSSDSITEIAAAGVDAGAAIAKNLIDGGVTAIQQTNELVASVTELANSLGTTTADAFYKTGVTNAQATVNGYIDTYGPEGKYQQDMIAAGNAAVTAMANSMGETFNATLQKQADGATSYAGKIRQLITLGLSNDAIQQVLATGEVAGNAIADSLITGGVDAINKTNAILLATQTMADSVGKLAADKYYGVGFISATNMVKAFIDNFGPKGLGRAVLMSAMDDLANSMNRTATVTIHTINPGGMTSLSGNDIILAPNRPLTIGAATQNMENISTLLAALTAQAKTIGDAASSQSPVTLNAPITNLTNPDPAAFAASLGHYMTQRVRD